MEYGSENNKNYYICPRYWCFQTNTSISEEDVKAGKCGKIIPKDPPGNKIPDGHYVYEFPRNNPFDKEGNYVHHRPGLFEIKGRKYQLPCCFKTGSIEKQLEKASIKEPAGEGRQANYIIKMESYPVEKERWGYLPIVAQLFLNMNYSSSINRNNPSFIMPNSPVLLRYGIEKSESQSFLALLAELYAYKQNLDKTPSIKEFKEILLREITLDIFVQIHNASLITSFGETNKNINNSLINIEKLIEKDESTSEFLQAIDKNNKEQYAFMENALVAYSNFCNYIKNDHIAIDHTYLWSLVTSNIPKLIKGGLNLILLNRVENDITPHIGLVCPTILSTRQLYDPKKESVIVLKQDDFYEPIYLYELPNSTASTKPLVQKTFSNRSLNANIKQVLENIQTTTNRYCAPLPSMPRVYEFTTPMRLDELVEECSKIGMKPDYQIMNFQGKIIGVLMKYIGLGGEGEGEKKSVFVPCYPTMKLPGIKTKYMDDITIWQDYETTRNMLTRINNETERKVKSAIRLKVVDENLVVGFLTETNQFVQINPPSENIYDGDSGDGIEVYYNPNMNEIDATVSTVKTGDEEREKRIRKIEMETDFYYAFKNKIRELLNNYKYVSMKKQIMELVQPDDVEMLDKTTYKEKYDTVLNILKQIGEKHITFEEIDDSVLNDLYEIKCNEKNISSNLNVSSDICLVSERNGKIILPKWHLYDESKTIDNSRIYYARIADELVRNERARLVLLDNKKYVNIKNLDYKINEDEFIIIQSALIGDYLKNLDVAFARNEYLRNVNYDNAHPAITQPYDNAVSLKEQVRAKEEEEKRIMQYEVREVIGNDRIMWKRIFKNKKEHVYGEDMNGAYNLIGRLFEETGAGGVGIREKVNMFHIKQLLWAAYSKYIDDGNKANRIYLILSKQGKSNLMSGVVERKMSFSELILSDKYTLSDLDIWMLASEYSVPLIVFNPNGLKGFPMGKITWIKMGGKMNDRFFFIRSLLDSNLNKVSAYNLIYPSSEIKELTEFAEIVRSAVLGEPEYKNNIIGINEMLEMSL